jgi:hypothetical protein
MDFFFKIFKINKYMTRVHQTSKLTIIKNGDEKNHERREVKFPDDIQQQKP